MDDHPELRKLRDQHLALQDRLHKACVKICDAKNEYAGIDQQLQAIAYYTPITSVPVYGGSDGSTFDQQKQALTSGVEVVVATPGKLMSHLNLGYVPLNGLEFLVLDEADRMMDMGFVDDITRIIGFLPKDRQTLMFSATMPEELKKGTRALI